MTEYIQEKRCLPEVHGHKRVLDEGVESVLVPMQGRKIRRVTLHDSTMAQDVADNTLALGSNDMTNMAQEALDSFGFVQATRTPWAATSAAPSTTAPPLPNNVPAIPTAPSAVPLAGSDSSFGSGFAPAAEPS